MDELIAKLIPLAWIGFGSLVGIGGNKWYYRRQNGNGNGHSHWDGEDERRAEPIVTRRECELTHKGIESELKEGNRRMGSVETLIGTLNTTILKHFDK